MIRNYFKSDKVVAICRIAFIKTQNALEEIIQKDAEINVIADGYTILGFEKLTNEKEMEAYKKDVISLELDTLREQYNSSMREVKKYESGRVKIEAIIDDKLVEIKEKKDELARLRMVKIELMKEMKVLQVKKDKLTARVGLRNRLNLLRNFDQLKEKVERSRVEISKLEKCNSEIMTKFVQHP
jgi:uncharacterized protein YsxB (DUF464 family)